MSAMRFVKTTLFVASLSAPLVPSAAWAVTPPYQEDFEAEALCAPTCGTPCLLTATGWQNSVTDNIDWTVYAGPTPTANTGPDVDHDPGTAAGKYLYVESSTPCFGGQVASLLSPPLELGATTNPMIAFWYHMVGFTMGDLHVDVWDGASWQLDLIPPFTADVDQWQRTPFIDLSPWAGLTINVRLRGVTGNNFQSDMAIDDFVLDDFPSDDVGVRAILEPREGTCGATADEVVVAVQNFGAQPQSNVPVDVQITGAVSATLSGVAPGPIAPLGGFEIVTVGTFDSFSGGTITVDAATSLGGDADLSNDAAQSMTVSLGMTDVGVLLPLPVCAGETASFSVAAPEPGVSYGWYDAPTAGNQLATGTSYTTPALTQTTTYYAVREAGPTEHVGPAANAFGTGGVLNFFPDRSPVFDVSATVAIETVYVYPNGPGDVTVRLLDSGYTVLDTTTVAVNSAGTKTPIALGFIVPPGTGYMLDAVGTTTGGLYRNDSGASYPYTGADLQITDNSIALPGYYYFFYDWIVGPPLCNAERTPVDAVVAPSGCQADLAVDIVDTPDPVDAGAQLSYTVTVTNNGAQDANDVAVTTALPADLSGPATSGCAEDPSGVPGCTLGLLAPGESAAFDLVVTVAGSANGTITTTVDAATSSDDANPSNDSASEDTAVNGTGGASSSGTGGASSSGTGGASSSGAGGASSSGGPFVVEDRGCGCRLPGPEEPRHGWRWQLWALASLALLARRRRQPCGA